MNFKTFKNVIIISSVYVGTVLGAGFASGQEMMRFFAYYGYKGMFGLVLTGMLFGIIGYVVLRIVYVKKCKSYVEFMDFVVGKDIRSCLDIIVLLFMFVCFCAMFAGSGALFEQLFGLKYGFGVFVMAMGCFLTFIFDLKGVVAINTILAPFLLVGTIILGIYIWYDSTVITANWFPQAIHLIQYNWITSAVVYVAYNCITAIVVLGSMGAALNKPSTVRLSAIFGGAALGAIGLVLGIVVLIHYEHVRGLEIPLLEIVMKYSSMIQVTYILLLLSAMFTTAVANGFGLIDIIKERSKYLKTHRWLINVSIILGAIAFSSIGFSNMVGRIYPIFGYLGIFELFIIGVYYLRERI